MGRIAMHRLLISFVCASMFGATTTVTQPVIGPDGLPASGQALIRISAACKSGDTYVGQRTIPVKFNATPPAGQANNFSVPLVPNDTCVVSGQTPAAWDSETGV